MFLSTTLLFDFTENSNMGSWYVVNDTVMGGRSNSALNLNQDGHAVFSGFVTTANNGGFASIRHRCDIQDIEDKNSVLIHLKGDGKPYQLRFKKDRNDYFSYIYTFETSGKWERVEIPVNEMYASYRGRTLNKPNFNGNSIEEISILIGNKKNQEFQLIIDKIEMR